MPRTEVPVPRPDARPVEATFRAALEALVEQIKEDRSILAAILCGSLSHDTVWAKSDIDLVLVTADDKQAPESHLALDADGVNVHAFLLPRASYRKTVDGELQNSFMHSLLAKGTLLYTHDESIAQMFARLRDLGERDRQIQLLGAATNALLPMYKARTWLLTRGDLHYTALWILYTAMSIARVEVIGRRLLADREVILQALALNPELFSVIYTGLLEGKRTRASVEQALVAIEQYLAERATTLFAPVLEHLREAGEARSCTEIEDHFKRNYGIEGVTSSCEYLADQGLIGRAAIPVRLTKRSNISVQELGFVDLRGGD